MSTSTYLKTKLDQKLDKYKLLQPTDETKDFLRDFFSTLYPDGQKNLVEDISQCVDDDALRKLVQSIKSGLLIPMKAHGGKTLTEITLSPRSGIDYSIENLKSLNIKPITRGPQSQLRNHCLERYGNKCLATGQYSHSHAHPQNALTTHLEAAHIIPFALGSFQDNNSEAVHRHAIIWVNLRRYFPVLCTIAFTSEQINSEKNILMLDPLIHTEFGQFRLIFKATGVSHQYRIKTFPDTATGPLQNLPRNRLVSFRVHKGTWDLPFFATHLATMYPDDISWLFSIRLCH